MSNITISEFSHISDSVNKPKRTATHSRTDVKVFIGGTDILLYRGTNKVILPGAEYTATCHFEIPRQYITPSYNTELNLEKSVYEAPTSPEKVFLFCVGTDGCGRENSQVYEVNYAKWCPPEYLVPFRFPLLTEDISAAKKKIYHGRRIIGNRVAYYFKEFETKPVKKIRFEDGTIVDSTVYNSTKESDVETFIELNLKVTEEECREFFVHTVGINEARINTISLCAAWKKEIDGETTYQDIRPLTKYNMPNEQLIELSKGLDIIYQIYY